MTERWQLRPVGGDEFPVVAALIRGEEIHYHGRSDATVEWLTDRIAAMADFDHERDHVMAERDGEVVGTAVVHTRGFNASVALGSDVIGLREALLDWGERRQAALGRDPFRYGLLGADATARALAESRGYAFERCYTLMVREFARSGAPEPAEVPIGYRLRQADPVADAEMLWRLDDRAFAERPDYEPRSLADFTAGALTCSEFSPEWSLVAESDAGEPAGLLVGWRRTARAHGYVAILAVDPGHRRHGLGRTLLINAIHRIHLAGLGSAELRVASDNPRALGLYEGVGMVQCERFDDYIRRP